MSISSLDNIFKEYIRLRTNGLQVNEAVRALSPYVTSLDTETRDKLAGHLRTWEHHRTQPAFADEDSARLLAISQIERTQDTTQCPECEKANAVHAVICFSCGGLLYPKHYIQNDTSTLPPTTDELINQAHFDSNAVLILLHEGSDYCFELYPQMQSYDLKIGRHGKGTNQLLDANLGELGDESLGVSRFHATIHYDKKTKTLQLFDMDSTNGTFVNEQRLHVNERRILRVNDVIRFGRLEMRIYFRVET